MHEGARTEAGLRENIRVGVQYLEAWLRGRGAVPLYNLMEDAATAEISRAQVWQWLHLKAKLDDGRVVTPELFKATFADEMAKVRAALGAEVYDKGRFAEATRLFEQMSLAPTFEEFLTAAGLQADRLRAPAPSPACGKRWREAPDEGPASQRPRFAPRSSLKPSRSRLGRFRRSNWPAPR